MAEREWTYNTRLAQELGKWAETKGKGDAFHNAVFRAYFAEAKNISQLAILLGLVKALELPEAEAKDVLEKRTFREAVDADWDLSQRLGISAVPTFILGTDTVVGAQPYEVLEQLLVEKGVKRIRKAV
jgi:predicted DsbA family dithiol-disulfide isomerase